MNRADFWASSPLEMWWRMSAMSPPQKSYAGGMSEDEVSAIYEDAYGNG
jgi:hypothetical protein